MTFSWDCDSKSVGNKFFGQVTWDRQLKLTCTILNMVNVLVLVK